MIKRAITLSLLVILIALVTAPAAYATGHPVDDRPLFVVIINSATAFFMFILGLRVTYLTRGGFLSLSFIFIIGGIMIGWVAKIGFEFLTNSAILTTSYDIVSMAEALGGIVLVAGFALLSRKLRS